MSDELRLVHEFTFHVACGPPHDLGAGPFGQRQYYALTEGRVDGPRLSGRLVGSGGDWMLSGPDGYMRMDVRIQIGADDGAIICAHYFGPAEANEALVNAVATVEPTAFSDQSIRTHWLLEAGDPRYAWVNQGAFFGQGRLRPWAPGVLGFEHRVYRLA